MEREDLRYWSEQHDIDARFTEIVMGGGAFLSPAPGHKPAAHHVTLGLRKMHRFVCSVCGYWYESTDSREINWCDHRVNKVYGQAPTLFKRVR